MPSINGVDEGSSYHDVFPTDAQFFNAADNICMKAATLATLPPNRTHLDTQAPPERFASPAAHRPMRYRSPRSQSPDLSRRRGPCVPAAAAPLRCAHRGGGAAARRPLAAAPPRPRAAPHRRPRCRAARGEGRSGRGGACVERAARAAGIAPNGSRVTPSAAEEGHIRRARRSSMQTSSANELSRILGGFDTAQLVRTLCPNKGGIPPAAPR